MMPSAPAPPTMPPTPTMLSSATLAPASQATLSGTTTQIPWSGVGMGQMPPPTMGLSLPSMAMSRSASPMPGAGPSLGAIGFPNFTLSAGPLSPMSSTTRSVTTTYVVPPAQSTVQRAADESQSLSRKTISRTPITREELLYQGRIIERDRGEASEELSQTPQTPERPTSVPPAGRRELDGVSSPSPPFVATTQAPARADGERQNGGVPEWGKVVSVRYGTPQPVGFPLMSAGSASRALPMPQTIVTTNAGWMPNQMPPWAFKPQFNQSMTPGMPLPNGFPSSVFASPQLGATGMSAMAATSNSTERTIPPESVDDLQTPPTSYDPGKLWMLGESPPPPLRADLMVEPMGGTGGSGSVKP